MRCTCAAKIDNAEKWGCTYVLKKINFFFIQFLELFMWKHVTNVTVWLVPLKQIGLADDVPLRNNS